MKAFDRIVELADQATDPPQICRRRGRLRVSQLAGYELRDVPSELVAPANALRNLSAFLLEPEASHCCLPSRESRAESLTGPFKDLSPGDSRREGDQVLEESDSTMDPAVNHHVPATDLVTASAVGDVGGSKWRSGERGSRLGRDVVLIGPDGLGLVPMRAPRGVCGLTISAVEMDSGAVATSLRGVWRSEFGLPEASPGDVVIELSPPPQAWLPTPAQRVATHVCVGAAGPVAVTASGYGSEDIDPVAVDAAPEHGAQLVQVRLLVAAHRGPNRSGDDRPGWLWLGSWPRAGVDWPYLVAPLVLVVMGQERRAAGRTEIRGLGLGVDAAGR